MSTRYMHKGTLLLDQQRRYYIYEPDRPASQAITLTSGTAAEVLLGSVWVGGHVEGDGQDYWLYSQTGGTCKLMEGMLAWYTEPGYMLEGRQPISLPARQ